MTQLPISLTEAGRPAAPSCGADRGAAQTGSATGARLPDWVFIPAAPSPAAAAAPEPPDLADCARQGAELLVLPTQAPPYARAVLTIPGRTPPDLPATCEPPARGLDKHGVDLALSIGRQAVERAKLGGIDRLICHAPRRAFEPAAAHARTAAAGIVEALATASPAVIALAGACLAASQIGIRTRLTGAAAQQALHLALAINPEADRWAGTAEAGAAPPSTHRAPAARGTRTTA